MEWLDFMPVGVLPVQNSHADNHDHHRQHSYSPEATAPDGDPPIPQR